MISAVAWIPRGAAKESPGTAEYTEEELAAAKEAAEGASVSSDGEDEGDEDMQSEEETSEDDEAAQVARAKQVAASLRKSSSTRPPPGQKSETEELDDAMAELDMENYDLEDEEDGGGTRNVFGNTNPGMMYYANNDSDPYLRLAAASDNDSEADDLQLQGEDFILLAARNQDEVSYLEVWVYEPEDASGSPPNLFVHHDVLLPAFPLSLAWLDCSPSGQEGSGNFAAVGTMSPGIEIWDLDVLETVEPISVLGGSLKGSHALIGEEADASTEGRKKKKKSKKKKKTEQLKEGSHTDAVLGLSWNSQFRNVLASSSADSSVKVWDIATQACQATLNWHTDKVQAVAWNPADAPVLLSGGFDSKVFLGDARTPTSNLSWETSADVEALAWDMHDPTRFLVSCEDGIVAAFDARSGGNTPALFRLAAHDKPACSLAFNPAARNLIATASTDKMVKLWDISSSPSLVASKDLGLGAIFTAAFCREQPTFLAAGGAKGDVKVWDILSDAAVANKYRRSFAPPKASLPQT